MISFLNKQEVTKADKKISEKERYINNSVKIITPTDRVNPKKQAKWLILLLNKMYHEHGVSKNVSEVVKKISSGQDKYWFALEKGKPVAVVGLIDQGGKVEIGRAVSFANTKGLGGFLYLKVARSHQLGSKQPLVAEVRAADEFKGVPNGIATLLLNYDYLGFVPHAFIPMFGHGNPYRQEFFLLGSDHTIDSSKSFIPDNKKAAQYIQSHGLNFAQEFVGQHSIVQSSQTGSIKFETVLENPITVVVPSKNGSSLETIEKSNNNPGILQVVELSPINMSAVLNLLENGFVPVGIDSARSKNGNTVLLLYKLNKEILLAPNVFEIKRERKKVARLFSQNQLRVIDSISSKIK